MNRNLIIGAGLAALLMLILLVAAGGSKPVPVQEAPRSIAESPIQKIAFMTEGSAPVPQESVEPSKPASK